jgi:hypothetical protein
MITGKELVEKMYSENYNEYEDTRLYSTGDSDLDELLEKAFCEGYEYAQREYSLKDELKEAIKSGDEKKIKELKKKSIGRKAAGGAIIGGAAGGIGTDRFLKKYEDDIRASDPLLAISSDKNYKKASNITSGMGAVVSSGIGAGIAAGIGKARFNKALKKAKKEIEEEKKNKNK